MFFQGKMMSATAGEFLDVLDNTLLTNSYWSKYDDETNGMTANEAVYRCYDPYGVVDFYMYVKNTKTDNWAVIELWESWDNVTHAGAGNRLYANGSYLMRIHIGYSYIMQVENFRFTFGCLWDQSHNFIGRPDELCDETKNIVIAITRSAQSSTQGYNPFGYGRANTPYIFKSLFDENGSVDSVLQVSWNIAIDGIDGKPILGKTKLFNITTKKVLGYITGNISCGDVTTPGLYGGQIKIDEDGHKWYVFGYSTASLNSLMRMI